MKPRIPLNRETIREYVDSLVDLVAGVEVDDTNIGDGKILVYNSATGKLEYQDPPAGTGTGNSYFPSGW